MKTYQNGDEWRQEFRALIDCKNAFVKDFTLSRSYHERKLPEFLKEIIRKHGHDRVRYVLATTINHAHWDGRYYRSVKEWAAQVDPSRNIQDTLENYGIFMSFASMTIR